jgi:hypothetical protein
MQGIREFWRRCTATRYTRMLEEDIKRLRAENRALLNSVLGIAGIPPIVVPAVEDEHRDGGRENGSKGSSGLDKLGVARLASVVRHDGEARRMGARSAGALRRRSWHQSNRALELDAARKKEHEPGDGPELGVAVKTQ